VLTAGALTFLLGTVANSQEQFPIMDKLAQKVIAKYQTSSCADLKAQKAEPPAPGPQAEMKAKVMAQLKSNPQMRQAFLNKVAPPIAEKMFECGMIP
jgi:hypothetical protein